MFLLSRRVPVKITHYWKKVSEDPDRWLALMIVFWQPEQKQTQAKDSKVEEV